MSKNLLSNASMIMTAVEALVFGSAFILVGSFIFDGRGAGAAYIAFQAIMPTGLVLLCLIIAGGYQKEVWNSPITMLKRVLIGSVGGAIVILLTHDLIFGHGKTAIEIVVATICGGVFAVTARLAGWWIAKGRAGQFMKRVLVLGDGERAESVKAIIQDMIDFQFIGFLPIGASHDQPSTEPAAFGKDVLKAEKPLLDYAIERQIDEVVVALDGDTTEDLHRDLLACRLYGITVTNKTAFVERETGRIDLAPNLEWLIYSPGFKHNQGMDFLKRGVDFVAAMAILLLTTPLMALVALAVRWDSPGPAIFRQTRTGLLGKPFTMYKFRSMRLDAEANGAQWASDNDPRITKVGRFIRFTRLDELPQLYNVIRGDMSLVGPRPERPEMIEKLIEEIPYYMERHKVRPGITGWAQTSYAYTSTVEDTKVKLEYDLYYLKNQSMVLDFMILLRTFRVALGGVGAR